MKSLGLVKLGLQLLRGLRVGRRVRSGTKGHEGMPAVQPITDLGPNVGRRDYLPTVGWRLRRWWSRLPPQSRFFSRGTHYRSAWTTTVAWTIAEVVPVGLLLGLGYLLGRGTSNLHWSQPWQALAQTATKPAVAAVLAFMLALVIAWWCRLARLAWLTWKPGEIVVPDFAKGSDLTEGVTEGQVTSFFRNRMAQLRLQSAAPTPGESTSSDFAEVLDSSAVSSTDVWKSLVALLRAAFPSHSIQVQGMVRERAGPEPERFGVVVQVSFGQGQTGTVLEKWDTSWPSVMAAAADGITAEILPRTRACRGPWAGWRGYQMPTNLLAAYEQAAEHEQAGRYDSALDRYEAALELDPTNVELRVRLAQLEEKLGLFLEALTSYQSIHALMHPGAKNLPRGLYRRGARREWERAVRIAKYRELVVLGEGSIIAQWCRTDDGEKLPKRTRRELRDEFGLRLRPLTAPRNDPTDDAISQAIRFLLDADRRLDPDDERELALKLKRWSYRGFEALRRSLPVIMLRPGDEPLTRTTVGLSMACVRQRYELLAGDDLVDDRGRPVARPTDLPASLDHQIAWARWRPGAWTRDWGPSLFRRRWHERYNAACLYAIPLSPQYAAAQPLSDPVRERLARRSVAQLERASASADSSFVETRRDWVLERDHDLDGLRLRRSEFDSFASVYFPDRGPRRPSAGPLERLAESRYTCRLLAARARSWHETWHSRAEQGWDVHEVWDWYREELELWTLVGEVAHRGFDWRLRARLDDHTTNLLVKHGQEPADVSFNPHANGSPVAWPTANGGASEELKTDRWRLNRLDALLTRHYGPRDRARFAAWLSLLRRCDGDSLPSLSPEQLSDLCHHQAAVWRALADWMEADGRSDSSRRAFRNELRQEAAARSRTRRLVQAS